MAADEPLDVHDVAPYDPPMLGRMVNYPGGSVNELVDWVLQQGLDPDEVKVTACHLRWQSPATSEETERREKWHREKLVRQERWERDAYERLRAKFEGGPT